MGEMMGKRKTQRTKKLIHYYGKCPHCEKLIVIQSDVKEPVVVKVE